MSNNKLLASFGDSWSFGTELADTEEPFGKIMADQLGMNFKNYSLWSTPIEHLIFQLRQCVEERQSYDHVTAIFFLTDYSRTLTINETRLQEISVGNVDFEPYYRDVYSDELGIFKANVIMLALQHICQEYNIEDYYVCGWTPIDFTLPGINKDRIFNQGLSTCVDILRIPSIECAAPDYFYHSDNYYFRPNICHPNHLGHQVIADTLTNWIKK